MVKLEYPALFREAAYINGEWRSVDGQPSIAVTNPASGKLVGSVPSVSTATVNHAIESAYVAFQSWRRTPAKERAEILRRWFQLIIKHREDLAKILTTEQGKPLAEARGEVNYGAAYFEWYSEEGKRTYGETIPSNRRDTRIITIKEPIGVCATITPWNFPSAMLARKVAPAIAAGCTVVSKPAELTPFSALALAVLAEEAGLPAGVWNVFNGPPQEVGAELCRNPKVRKLTFTGSTQTGRTLMAQCAPTIKKLSLELGGNAPFIVFRSANIDAAVKGAMLCKFRNNGQTCVCANRFLVEREVATVFSEKLATAMSKLKVGEGFCEGVDTGPLINLAAVEKVENHIADAIGSGAKVICGGRRHTLGGTFFEPTLITDAKPSMKFSNEETFGPLAAIIPFDSEEEVLRIANNTEFGLAAYLYSGDVAQLMRVAELLEVGMVGLNEGVFAAENLPFGGVKQSGFGREGGHLGIEDYMQVKCLHLGGL